MRKLLCLLTLLLAIAGVYAQTSLSSQEQALYSVVQKKHLSPKAVDDVFSDQCYTTCLTILDASKHYFSAVDLKKLEPFRHAIDDDWMNGTTAFYSTLSTLYKAKLQAAQSMITEVCSKPFDFSLPEFYNYSDTSVALTDKALLSRWTNLLKFEVLRSLMNVASNQWQTKGAIVKTEVLQKEPEVRARIKTKYLNRIASFIGNYDDYEKQLTSLYLNALLLCLDPHSAYFDPTARQQFKEQLNTEGYFFGLSITNNERGEVIINHLSPGSPAWMCGLLNKDDILVKLKWEGSVPVDLTGLDAGDVSALFELHTKEKMELTVRKGNGQLQTVTLQKQKLQNEENIVQSFVLAGKQNIGYIMLPSFYTEWEDKAGSRCAADVGREIVKLKKDSIAGLVLDLRFNGGGSVDEAIEMAGIFIDDGVVSQIKTKEAKPEVLRDMNRGVIYNGPLLVLVNGQSASASEVVAAALQDYNRAIIAGSPTYGKATGQEIFPLNEGSSHGSQPGFAKLTMMKLYRPTGKTAQKFGVQPDIVLPDVYQTEESEANEPFALPQDTTAAYKYFKPMKPLSLNGLQEKSTARMAANSKMTEAKRLMQLLNSMDKKGKVSLKWEDAEKEAKLIAHNPTTIFKKPTELFTARNNTIDQKSATTSTVTKELNAFWLNRLNSDFYIEEAFQILNDFIQSH